MLTLAISLLIGFAAAMAVQVIHVSVRQALRGYARLAGELALIDGKVRSRRAPTIRSQPRYAAA